VADTAQQVQHRDLEPARQFLGLVESSNDPTPWMERNRHDEVSASQHIATVGDHQASERSGECSASFVFERVHNRTKSPVVLADRTARRNHVLTATACATRVALNSCL
jgi:hypothetical protein